MNDVGKLEMSNTQQSCVVHPKHVDLTHCLLCMPLNKHSRFFLFCKITNEYELPEDDMIVSKHVGV